MPQCGDRMIKQHPRPHAAHHIPDTLAHILTIAMNPTMLAHSFPFAKRTMGQALQSVVPQLNARRAHFFIVLHPPAIQSNHLLHHSLFLLNTFHFAGKDTTTSSECETTCLQLIH